MIHATAVVDATARVHPGATIGPFCVVGPDVEIGEGCRLLSHVVVHEHTVLGPGCVLFPGASIGAAPQDLNAMMNSLGRQPARCDEVAWSLFGVSMAGYNFLIALGLSAFSVWAAVRAARVEA